MYPRIYGLSGWQGCNLCEINGEKCNTPEDFYLACEAGSTLGTMQAGYTDFKFLEETSTRIFDREALIGVSVTGWMNNPEVLFDEKVLRKGAQIVKETNKTVAEMIGINPAARTTCVKPAGNASVLLGTASGIHGEHAPMYLRHVQLPKDAEVSKLIERTNPSMLETSVYNPDDWSVAFPVVAPENSVFREDLFGVKQLEYVKLVQQVWVEEGTNVDLCIKSSLRHNVSNTISVDNWDEVARYVYDNRAFFAGISFLAASGDKDYPQAPNAAVLTEEQLLEKYGEASFFASGLIVDGLEAFNGDLWDAISCILWNREIDISKENILKIDFIRRFKKFSENYFDGDLQETSYCLKDIQYFHKWSKIQRNLNDIDWVEGLQEKEYTDIDTMGAIACAGGACSF